MAGGDNVPEIEEVLLDLVGEDVDIEVLVTALDTGVLEEHDEVVDVLHVLFSVLGDLGVKGVDLLGLHVHLLDDLAHGALGGTEDVSVYDESLVLEGLWLLEDGEEVGNGGWHSVVVRLLGEGEVSGSLLALLSALGLKEFVLEIVLGEEGVSRVGLSLGVERGALSTSSGGALGDW